jgi:hypothetical protein
VEPQKVTRESNVHESGKTNNDDVDDDVDDGTNDPVDDGTNDTPSAFLPMSRRLWADPDAFA